MGILGGSIASLGNVLSAKADKTLQQQIIANINTAILNKSPGQETQSIIVNGKRNTNLFCYSYNITSASISGSANSGNGCLVTPQHYITSVGNPELYKLGATVTWCDNSGDSFTQTVIASEVVANTDIVVVKLNEPLPSSIAPARVLGPTYLNYLPSIAEGVPIISLTAEKSICIIEWWQYEGSVRLSTQAYSNQAAWNFNPLSGSSVPAIADLGSPCYALISNKAVFLGPWAQNLQLSFISQFYEAVNALISTLDGGSGYSLTDIDLTPFTSY